nr:SRPBCC domain-containing protein [Allomuricauda sp.]
MKTITWKLNLKSNPTKVFDLIATSEGRKKFWAEESKEDEGMIHFSFPNGQTYRGQILKVNPPQEFHLDYFDSLVKFRLTSLKNGGTDLTLINENVSSSDFSEVHAGWISVLMNLKAVADFQCDLRNHNPEKTWNQGYVDN